MDAIVGQRRNATKTKAAKPAHEFKRPVTVIPTAPATLPALPILPFPSSHLVSGWNLKAALNAAATARRAKSPRRAPATQTNAKRKSTPAEPTSLHDRFLTAAEVRQLQASGIHVKTGRFDQTENALVKTAVESYCTQHGIPMYSIGEFLDRQSATSGLSVEQADARRVFWKEIASHFPARTLNAIYHHVRRVFDPLNVRQAWQVEDLKRLASLVAQFGKDWKRIGAAMGRTPDSCRFRYRVVHAKLRSNLPDADLSEQERKTVESALLLAIVFGKLRTGQFPDTATATVDGLIDSHLTIQMVHQCLEQPFTQWSAAEAVFNRLSTTGPLCVDSVRLRCTCSLFPGLRFMLGPGHLGTDVEDEQFTYRELVQLWANTARKRRATAADDLNLLRAIRRMFPKAKRVGDIRWSTLSQEPELNDRSQTFLSGRLGLLARLFLKKRHLRSLKVRKHCDKLIAVLEAGSAGHPLYRKVYNEMSSQFIADEHDSDGENDGGDTGDEIAGEIAKAVDGKSRRPIKRLDTPSDCDQSEAPPRD